MIRHLAVLCRSLIDRLLRTAKDDLPQASDYWAFLSYSSNDRRLAEWLHGRLERYRVPWALVGSEGKHGLVPRRVRPVFLDRADARAAADVEGFFATTLLRSQQLIVLCTPCSASSSSFVAVEIETFRATQPDAPVHAIIGYGQPPECFPAQLLSSRQGTRGGAPLAADLRPQSQGGDGRRKAVVKLIAAVIDVGFDELWKREVRRAQWRVAIGVVATLAVGGLVAFSVDRSREARRQGWETSVLALRDRVRTDLATTNHDKDEEAALLALQAHQLNIRAGGRNDDAVHEAFADVLGRQGYIVRITQDECPPSCRAIGGLAITPDGAHLLMSTFQFNADPSNVGMMPGPMFVWEITPTLQAPTIIPMKAGADAMEIVSNGKYVVTGAGSVHGYTSAGFEVWDLSDGRPVAVRVLGGDKPLRGLAAAHHGSRVAAIQGSAVFVWDLEKPNQPPLELSIENLVSLALDPTGQVLAVATTTQLRVFELESPVNSVTFESAGCRFGIKAGGYTPAGPQLVFNEDGTVLACASDEGILYWRRHDSPGWSRTASRRHVDLLRRSPAERQMAPEWPSSLRFDGRSRLLFEGGTLFLGGPNGDQEPEILASTLQAVTVVAAASHKVALAGRDVWMSFDSSVPPTALAKHDGLRRSPVVSANRGASFVFLNKELKDRPGTAPDVVADDIMIWDHPAARSSSARVLLQKAGIEALCESADDEPLVVLYGNGADHRIARLNLSAPSAILEDLIRVNWVPKNCAGSFRGKRAISYANPTGQSRVTALHDLGDGTTLPMSGGLGVSMSRSGEWFSSGTHWFHFPLPTGHGTPQLITDAGAVSAVSADDRWLASAGSDIELIDTREVSSVARLRGDGVPVTVLAFDRTSSRLASGYQNGLIRVWSLADRSKRPLLLRDPGKGIVSLLFDETGRRLISLSMDDRVRIWPIDLPEMAQEVCSRVFGRRPSESWRQIVGSEAALLEVCGK